MNHYFLRKNLNDVSEGYKEISGKEFYRIIEADMLLPAEKRHIFNIDEVPHGRWKEKFYWEATPMEHKSWRRYLRIEDKYEDHDKKLRESFEVISLDALCESASRNPESDSTCGGNPEVEAVHQDTMALFDKALDSRPPYERRIAQMYAMGESRACARTLAPEFGKSKDTIRNYRKKFDKFASDYLAE